MKKEFFIKDLTGRGYHTTSTEDLIKLAMDNDTDDNDQELFEFVQLAEIGDKWRTNSTTIERIK